MLVYLSIVCFLRNPCNQRSTSQSAVRLPAMPSESLRDVVAMENNNQWSFMSTRWRNNNKSNKNSKTGKTRKVEKPEADVQADDEFIKRLNDVVLNGRKKTKSSM